MSSPEPKDTTEQQAVSEAIRGLDNLIDQHKRSARNVAISVAVPILLLLAGWGVHLMETRIGTAAVADFSSSARTLERIAASSPPGEGMQVSMMLREIQPRIEAIAGYSNTVGVQYYNSLILSLGLIFVAMFAVLMSIYRHHLNEVAKLQNAKLAFVRVGVALQSASTQGGRSLFAQAALLERAFEYRTGKEKGPVPGHPISDVSALLVEKLVEALSKRPHSET